MGQAELLVCVTRCHSSNIYCGQSSKALDTVVPLTPRQQRFVEEYMVDLNATQAAARAGYKDGNIGRQLITKNNVAAAIQVAKEALSKRTGITVERVAKELALLGFVDMGTYIKLDASETTVRLDWTALPEGATRCIQEITQEEHTGGKGHEVGQIRRTKFKLYDKKGSLELLGRHLGMFNDKMTHDVGDGLVDLMKRIDGKTRGL